MLSNKLGGGSGSLPTDPQFNKTTLLLHGDGTNGAQNNTFIDSSSNNFTITRAGNVTQGSFSPFSPRGWSGYFDGASYVSTAASAVFGMGTGDFIVECLFYPTALTSRLVTLRSGTTLNTGLQLLTNASGYPMLGRYGVDDLVSSTPITLNAWNHIVVSRLSGTARIFLNGTQIASAANTIDYGSSWPCVVGYDAGGPATYSQGYISNVRIVKGSGVSSVTVPTAPLTAITNTVFLGLQDNRFKDNSANNFAISTSGSPSIQPFSPFAPTAAYSSATHGGSGYFDGTGDYLALPTNQAALQLGNSDFSAEAWVYRTSTSNGVVMIGQTDLGTVAGSSYGFVLSSTSTSDLYSGGTTFALTSPNPPLNQWCHVAWARTGGVYSSYLNGARVATLSTLGTSAVNNGATTYPPSIGGWPNGAADASLYIQGLRLIKGSGGYNANLTTIQVPTAPPTAIANTSLLCNFTNGAIIDSAGCCDLETVGNAQISTTVKKYGTGSISFNGTTDYLPIAANPLLYIGTGNFTLEGWINPTNFSAVRAIFSFANNNVFYLNTSGIPYYGIYSVSDTAIGSTAVSTGTFSHIAFVRNGTTLTCYIGGNLVGSITTASSIGSVSAANYVGMHRSGNYWLGYLDEIRISNYARYTANFTPPTGPFADK